MGRIPYIDVPKNALGLVRPRHREIMRRLIFGQSQSDIAREMGISDARLSIVVRSPLFRAELKRMERDIYSKVVDNAGDVAARIFKLQEPSLNVIEQVLTDPKAGASIKLKADVAFDVLEMAGAKKNRNADGMSDFAQFISEAYEEAKARAFNRLNGQLEAEAHADADADADADAIIDAVAVADGEEGEAEDLALASASASAFELELELEAGNNGSGSKLECKNGSDIFEKKTKTGAAVPLHPLELVSTTELQRDLQEEARVREKQERKKLESLFFAALSANGVTAADIRTLLDVDLESEQSSSAAALQRRAEQNEPRT